MTVGNVGAIRVREDVRASDAGRVSSLVAATGFFNEAEVAIARELVDEHLRKGGESGYWFVLADAGKDFAGYACFGPVPATTSSYHLYWIAVAPPWQGRGVGRLLLERVESIVLRAGGERIYAETSTREQYAPTNAFYRRTGFRLVASLPDHFAPGEDKAIYEKAVRGSP